MPQDAAISKGATVDDQKWLKYGVIALGAVGFIALLVAGFGRGGDVAGRTWTLSQMYVDGDGVTPIDGAEPTATFDTDGNVYGTGGCNTYRGSYGTDGDTITIGPLATTLKYCEQPDGAMDQEGTFLALMQSADSYRVRGGTLTLYAGDEAVVEFSEAG